MTISINLLNQEEHIIPSILDDSKNITGFLQKNAGKKVVVVQGLGFVGAVVIGLCQCNYRRIRRYWSGFSQ